MNKPQATNQLDQSFFDQPEDLSVGTQVLIVDDEKMARAQLSLVCSSATELDIQATACCSVQEAIDLMLVRSFDVILLDKDLYEDRSKEGSNGIEAIPELLSIQPHAQIIVVTGSKDLKDCVRAMQLGAFGYVHKGDSDDFLIEQIRRSSQLSMMKSDRERIQRQKDLEEGRIDFAGKSASVRTLKKRLSAVAETSRPVLLVGETGTGKTTAAKYIHQYRETFLKQSNRPFLSINMGALPANLVEGELFGHERGAFTDAKEAKAGYFEMANNGTLFLDEIGDAPLDLQVKLLKVIEEGKFLRVGGTREKTSSFKLICATNRNLEAMVREGSFREDLYMRISTFVIEIPSLSERKEDIPDILSSVFKKCCRENNKNLRFQDFPKDLMEALLKEPPRGNIRGLEQFLSRLLVLAPQDKNGQPQLSAWKRIDELKSLFGNRKVRTQNTVSVKNLRQANFMFDDPDFPGAREFADSLIDQIILDSRSRFRNQREMAGALRITPGALSQRLKKMKEMGLIDEK